MRVAIVQSAYIPWRGYFDIINSVDKFVIFDDVKYPQGRSWRNRNKIKTRDGLKWITIPIQSGAHHFKIDEVSIAKQKTRWQQIHSSQLHNALGEAKYFSDAYELWQREVSLNPSLLSELNSRLIKSVCEYLEIKTEIIQGRDLEASGVKTERLINIIHNVGGDNYLSGPSAKSYIDHETFCNQGIGLEYKSYDYLPYPQLWGPFEGGVSILDLIANCGPQAKFYINSLSTNEIAVEA